MNSPLQVPFTEKTRHLLLDTDSRKLAADIRDLPYADIPTALLIAHRRLHTFNRFSLPPAKRLELLRPFHYAFVRFVEHYRRHFEGSVFSRELNPNELDNLTDFLREMGYGFKHLIHDTLDRNRRPGNVGLILFMTLNYLYYYALFSYNRGRMLQPSFWQEVHYLYFTACSLQAHQTNLQAPEGKQVIIEQFYKQLVMLGLSSPFSLSPEEQWRAHDYLSRFASFVDIHPDADSSDFQEGYSVFPDCTQPAAVPYQDDTLRPGARLLDLSRFVDNLQHHLEAIKGGEPLRLIGMDRQQRGPIVELLLRLHRNWTRNPLRKYPRVPIDEQIGIVWGLENICMMLDPQLRRQKAQLNRNDSNRAWAHGDNESNSGIRLRLEDDDGQGPEAGQVVALIRQKGEQKKLEVGVVQWSAIDKDNQPCCGVECLRGNVRKISVQAESSDEINTERNGLLVITRAANNRARSLLLTPNGTLKQGHQARILSPQRVDALLAETFAVLQRTRQAEVYEVRILE